MSNNSFTVKDLKIILSKRFFTILVVLFGIIPCPAFSAEPLKTMTWNLQWFPGGRPEASKAEQIRQMNGAKAILVEQSPDIFLAQELTNPKAFSNLVANIPGMKVHVFSNFLNYDGKNPGPLQCAIASKLNANSAWFESFKPSKGLPNLPRGFAFAALEYPAGGLIMLYSVHLKSNHGSDTPEGEKDIADTRAESVRQLIAHKAAMEKKFAGQKILGWLIGGDFNTNHDGQFPMCTAIRDLVNAGFHNSWGETSKVQRLTWRNDPKYHRYKSTTFDYILTSGFEKSQAKIISGVPLDISDHAPLVISLSVK